MPRQAKAEEAASPLIDLACACASARRAARLVTQLYAQEMGPLIEPTQFALLFALDQYSGRPQSLLGRALGLDKTTLSRNLRLLQRNGWIEAADADDERERGYRLTATGKETLASAKPGWKRAQDKLRAAMKADDWKNMMSTFGLVARAAQEARIKSK
jgi:DNA-binding MarR family transcriptional regulator